MQKQVVSRKLQEKVEKVLPQNRRGRPSKKSLFEALQTLIKWLRGMRSAIRRLEVNIEYVQQIIVDLMKRLNLREYSFGRTTVQRIVRLQISNKEDYEKVIKIIGEKRAGKWIQIERKRIPAHVETRYTFTEEGLEKIRANPILEEKIKQALNAPEYIVILPAKRVS